MKDFSVKKVVLCSLMFLISLFTLLALCFHLVNVSIGSLVSQGESGFSFFDFSSQMIGYPAITIPFGIICIAELIISLVMIALSLVAFFNHPKEKYRITGKKIITLGIVFCSIYLVMGIVCAIVFRVVNGSGAEYGGSVMTYAFIPLLLVIIFAIAYKICNKNIPESLSANETKIAAVPDKFSDDDYINNEFQKAILIKEYGELLDKGYITREEFDAKKKEILNVGTAETTE